jgi:hypothetical protein
LKFRVKSTGDRGVKTIGAGRNLAANAPAQRYGKRQKAAPKRQLREREEAEPNTEESFEESLERIARVRLHYQAHNCPEVGGS